MSKLKCTTVLSIASLFVIAACADQADRLSAPSQPNAVIIIPPRPQPGDYANIVAGGNFTCARRNSGAVFCWGADASGQTGDAGSGDARNPCVINRNEACAPVPHAVLLYPSLDTLRALSIDAGYAHACVVNTTNDGWCWGDGNVGQLGYGPYGDPYQPMPVAGGLKFSSIGTGNLVTCGTATTGVFCWGQHADWSQNAQFEPDQGTPLQISTYTGYSTLTVGAEHACSTEIVGSFRAVDCWGIDSVGQVGVDPAVFPLFAPFTVRAGFGTSVIRVATGDFQTCAELSNGTLECVGANGAGQLGNGSTGGFTFTPVLVGGGQQLHGVSIGATHACALDGASQAWCWGGGSWGELGNGSAMASTVPVAVSGGLTFRAITAGVHHTCAIGTDNALYCWGANYDGQMGQNSSNNIAWTTPGRVYDPR